VTSSDTDQAYELEESRRLEADHPRWRVWKSAKGTWWAAFADGPWTTGRERHGCWANLHEATSTALETRLQKADACEKCWGADVSLAA
jgi:hypothetical protein